MFSFEPTIFFPKDPVVLKQEKPKLFAETCAALDIGIKSVEKTMSQALAVSVSLLKAAAEKAAAEKAAKEAAVKGIMDLLTHVPREYTCNHDNGWKETNITSEQINYFHGWVKEQDGKYSLSVQTEAGFDVCLHNVKITSKGCRWFFAEKITINDEIVAVNFLRENFGLYEDLNAVCYRC